MPSQSKVQDAAPSQLRGAPSGCRGRDRRMPMTQLRVPSRCGNDRRARALDVDPWWSWSGLVCVIQLMPHRQQVCLVLMLLEVPDKSTFIEALPVKNCHEARLCWPELRPTFFGAPRRTVNSRAIRNVPPDASMGRCPAVTSTQPGARYVKVAGGSGDPGTQSCVGRSAMAVP